MTARYKIEYEDGDADFVFAGSEDDVYEFGQEEAIKRGTQIKEVKPAIFDQGRARLV